jgi:hypothetical protein
MASRGMSGGQATIIDIHGTRIRRAGINAHDQLCDDPNVRAKMAGSHPAAMK